jgi:hypothetical protein
MGARVLDTMTSHPDTHKRRTNSKQGNDREKGHIINRDHPFLHRHQGITGKEMAETSSVEFANVFLIKKIIICVAFRNQSRTVEACYLPPRMTFPPPIEIKKNLTTRGYRTILPFSLLSTDFRQSISAFLGQRKEARTQIDNLNPSFPCRYVHDVGVGETVYLLPRLGKADSSLGLTGAAPASPPRRGPRGKSPPRGAPRGPPRPRPSPPRPRPEDSPPRPPRGPPRPPRPPPVRCSGASMKRFSSSTTCFCLRSRWRWALPPEAAK